MAQSTLNGLLTHIRDFSTLSDRLESDRELLHKFQILRDENAFESLVRRHSHVVIAACRQVLTETADIDDAFQATFLVLIRRAKSVNWKESLGSWLYAVAHRVATRARIQAQTRKVRELNAGRRKPAAAPADLSWREACAILHVELDRLPVQYRKVLLLCYLDGQSRDEAARNLGCSAGAVKGNLERGRRMLGRRLARRGITLSAGLLAAAASQARATALGVSTPLIESACRAATGGASPIVAALAASVEPTSRVAKRFVLGLLLSVGFLGAGFTLAASGIEKEKPPAAKKNEPPAPKPESKSTPSKLEAQEETREMESTVAGQVVDPDGKPVAGGKVYWIPWGYPIPKPTPRATTNRDGRFSFRFRHPINNTRPQDKQYPGDFGYAVVLTPGFGPGWGYDAPGGDQMNLKIITTPDTIPIRGKIIDLEGRPVVGVKISVRTLAAAPDWNNLMPWIESKRNPKRDGPLAYLNVFFDQMGFAAGGILPTAVSDKNGQFELRGVGRDRTATVRLEGDNVETQQLDIVTRNVERFSFRENNQTHTYYGCSCTLVAAPSVPIVGIVKDKDTGQPIAGATIIPDSLGIDSHGRTIRDIRYTSDANGRFRLTGFPRKPRAFSLTLNVFRLGDEPYVGTILQVPAAAEHGPTKFDIELKRGIRLTIKAINKRTGRPVAAMCEYYPHKDNVNLRDYPNDWASEPFPVIMKAMLETRRTAIPGRGVVIASVLGGGDYLDGIVPTSLADCVKDGQFNTGAGNFPLGSFHSVAEVNLGPGARSAEVTVALDPGFSVPGLVIGSDGKELSGSIGLGLSPRTTYFNQVPMPSSQFEARALRPIQKRRVIIFNLEKKLAGSVIVIGGQKDQVNVRLEPWGAATGRLVDEAGRAVKDGVVSAETDDACFKDLEQGASPLWPTRNPREVSRDGRFRMNGLAPGLKYRFIVYRRIGRKDGPQTPIEVTVKPGENKDLGDIVVKSEEMDK